MSNDRKAYYKEYFSKPENKARNAKNMRERYRDNLDIREARKAYQVEYRANNADKIKARRLLNRDKNIAYCKAYRELDK
jgi:hypothetical protein